MSRIKIRPIKSNASAASVQIFIVRVLLKIWLVKPWTDSANLRLIFFLTSLTLHERLLKQIFERRFWRIIFAIRSLCVKMIREENFHSLYDKMRIILREMDIVGLLFSELYTRRSGFFSTLLQELYTPLLQTSLCL